MDRDFYDPGAKRSRICQWYDGHWFLARDYSRQSGVGFCDASCGGENLRFGMIQSTMYVRWLTLQAYIVLSIVFGLVLWLVPQFYASAVAVALQGFFLGPLFPAVVVVTTKLLPRHLHVSSIGFAAAFGGGGAAVLPFAAGAIAQLKGVKVLQPFILGLSGGILILWLGLPRLNKIHRGV